MIESCLPEEEVYVSGTETEKGKKDKEHTYDGFKK